MNRNPDKQQQSQDLKHLPPEIQRARVDNAKKLEEDGTPPRRQNEVIEQYLERPRKRRSTRNGAARHPQG